MAKNNNLSPYDLDINMGILCNSTDKKVQLVNVYAVPKYENGKATDIIEGYKYRVKLPYRDDKYLYVKIPGDCQITQEVVEGKPLVEFEGVKCTFYTNKNGYPDLSVKAERITIE